MIEMRRLKNVVIFIQTILSFVLSRKIISDYFHKTTNQLWTENSKMTGLKDCKSFQKNVSRSLAK